MMRKDILQLLPKPSGAIKNTLDYFLEEYFFKPSAIVSYSPGIFGGINAAQQLRLVFAELEAPSIPSSFTIPSLHRVFSEDGKLIDETYNKRVSKFLDEFEWYIEAFKNQRANGTPSNYKVILYIWASSTSFSLI
jgi:NAD(P)H-dependent FMN reductase